MNFQTAFDARGNLRGWLKQLRNRSGVYVIRKPGWIFHTTLYVGESHTNNLKRTLMRHFQKWTGKTSGPTYPKTTVEVGVLFTKPSEAVEKQNELIRELQPRDNVVGKDVDPF